MAFNRQIELQIGKPGEIGLLIKDLRISFSVEKTDTESANTAIIQIYNLTDDTIKRINRAGNILILRAGYEDEGIKTLFFGTVINSTDMKTGTERILEIQVADGVENIQDKNLTISYRAGTTVQKIFNDLILLFGLPLTNIGFSLSGQYVNGWSFCGKIKDAITEVLDKAGLSWTVQNNQLVVIESGKSVERTGLFLTPDTGLLDSPEILVDTDNTPTEEPPARYKIRSLLFPQLFPGVDFKLKSKNVSGNFKVETAKFSGDNYEGDFICELEVVQI